ncbi:TPA: ATP-binding cassette domain-containing protein [Klebsiella pneumoniae]|nr:thiosulfate sulfurtransferase [Klebsiella pneumoniae]ODP12900.1 thiosulfate sulfurtransferase [Klebsiella pneumoniae]HBW8216721.1 ATP-binding cassette domain-containing protein [Klebsiella pneumoniae]
MLTVNHLTLSVRRQPLLREVAFSVAPGEVLTLMGPSGSGKSTLFAWMIGALSGDFRARGELWLNERRCDTLPTEHRRIGILFQDPLLFDHFSVGQNLQLALPENVRGEARLKQTGFTRLSTLSDALSQTDRLQKLPHFEQLVYPQWLHDLQQGKAVAAAPAGDWKVFEAAWGAPKLYLLSHIPGAGYIDTNEVESEPLWNKVSDAQLKAMLAKHGIRHDTTVILYGRDVYAATRVAQIMLYAGVKDVRLLDGGWQTWSDAGLPVERGMPPAQQPAPDFGAPIPGQPQLMLDTEQARGLLHRQDASLVSVRSWPEFIGTTSGYSYIKPKGDIAGARWGHAGSDSTHMEDFHNPDGTMRSADDIATLWRQWNILPSQQVAFYCGTGWRASETFMYARAMGWPHVAVYDGGWYEWSSNPHNPVARGERGPESSQ